MHAVYAPSHDTHIKLLMPYLGFTGTPTTTRNVGVAGVLLCPADRFREQMARAGTNSRLVYSYGINCYTGHSDHYTKIYTITAPADLIYQFDGFVSNGFFVEASVNSYPFHTSSAPNNPTQAMGVDFRHGPQANLLFVGGNVANCSFDNIGKTYAKYLMN